MLINISEEEYHRKFPVDPHLFLSREFLEQNKSKTDQIFRLVEDNSKPSLGLVAGLKDGYLLCPFSAPFGGFHFNHEIIFTNFIDEYIQNLKYFIKTNGLRGINITLPPNIYHETINSKLINCLLYSGFQIETCDITSWVDLELFDNRLHHYGSRKCLNQALKHGLSFKTVTKPEEKREAYEIIKMNRLQYERPIYMSFNDLAKIEEIWDIDYFVVCDSDDHIVASSINYRFHKSIVYAVFWGDNQKGRSLRAMDFCVFSLFNYYKQAGYKYLDIGISTEAGIPNDGLLRFKETHEATSSLKYTFTWSNQELGSTDINFDSGDNLVKTNFRGNNKIIEYPLLYNIQPNIAVIEPITRYGVTLRLVEVDDAEFIIKLRSDQQLNRFISYTSPEIGDQIRWIKEYKIREKAGLEYYFIAQDQNRNKYGTIRLYNRDERSFEIGSWLFQSNSPIGMAVKAHFIGFETGFEVLKAEYCKFEIRKKNTAVLRYMKDFETTLVKEDSLNFYLTLTKENFYKRRSKLSIFSSKSIEQTVKVMIHPTSEVQTRNIGEGTMIWQYCVILKEAVIGQNCNINFNVFIENDVIVGDNVTIKSGVQLWDGLRIEDNVFISPNVAFTNDFSPRSKKYPNKFLSTLVKEGASIGANSTIIGGITIGKYSMIGAGSLVTKNIPDYNLWYGHPATFKAYICKCGQKLNNLYICDSCDKRYKSTDGIISEL